MSIDALFGREEQDIQLLLSKKLSKLPGDEAYNSVYNICWSMIIGLVGDEDYAEDFMNTFMGHSYTNRDKSPDYFSKLLRDDGIISACLSSDFNQFFLFAESNGGSILDHLEDMEAIRKVFAVFAEKNLLKISIKKNMPVDDILKFPKKNYNSRVIIYAPHTDYTDEALNCIWVQKKYP